METAPSLTTALSQQLQEAIRANSGWLGFERFMELALYSPGLGYYAGERQKFGLFPLAPGSDFVTAPEMSPFFGRALATQVAQALEKTGTRSVWEFGAGSGALARQLLQSLGDSVDDYVIVDLSGSLRQRQQAALEPFGAKVRWVEALPAQIDGVVIGNELLDAMPVTLLARCAGAWYERGVALDDQGSLVWQHRPSSLRPPLDVAGGGDYLTEIHPQAEAFVRTLAQSLRRGVLLLIDYGFPEREYYHAQRCMGTLVCHQAHRVDHNPLSQVGAKDITAHINFTGLALAAQDAVPQGLTLLGYTSQARFLMNCGILDLLQDASLQQRAMAQKLLLEHEMGELFKVIAWCRGEPWDAIGFAQGDRSATL